MECLAALAVDKHLEVRRMAEQALAAVHSQVDSGVLREHLASVDLASDARTTLLQILQVPTLHALPPFVRSTKNCIPGIKEHYCSHDSVCMKCDVLQVRLMCTDPGHRPHEWSLSLKASHHAPTGHSWGGVTGQQF